MPFFDKITKNLRCKVNKNSSKNYFLQARKKDVYNIHICIHIALTLRIFLHLYTIRNSILLYREQQKLAQTRIVRKRNVYIRAWRYILSLYNFILLYYTYLSPATRTNYLKNCQHQLLYNKKFSSRKTRSSFNNMQKS